VFDVVSEIEAIEREVGSGRFADQEARIVRLRRTYDAPIEEVWDALSNPDRIGRWFLPISGDLRVGGQYQFEGNARGEIIACERPNRLAVTWGFGEELDPAASSGVEVRLSAAGDESTTLELVHTAVVPPEMWEQFGPGAVGVGWEGGFLGLALHLRGGEISAAERDAFPFSAEGRDFYTRSSTAWGEANVAAGADAEVVTRNVAATTTFYTTDPTAETS
jgi:uncharacterized protein YndB with AHSA1/START domain